MTVSKIFYYCHSELCEESQAHETEILRYALYDNFGDEDAFLRQSYIIIYFNTVSFCEII